VSEPDIKPPAGAESKQFYSGLFDREEIDTRTSPVRRVLAVLIGLVGLACFALYVWGALDTNHNVFLKSHFGAPSSGVFVLLVFTLAVFFVGYPVRAAQQRRRSRVRTTVIVLTAVAGIVAVVFHALGLFKYDPKVVATSPGGDRQAALVNGYETNTLRIFAGSGLGRREVGNAGVICGLESADRVVFDGDNSLKVSTPYNDVVIPLDPKTGVPLKHFGPRCDGPLQ
jgi:hypothetical protein